MVFVKKKNGCGMAAKWILGNKKGRRKKTPPETKRSEKTLGIYKRNKTPNMPTSEELWGDSQSGLAANAPFRSALS
jgi:hypothetical protein